MTRTVAVIILLLTCMRCKPPAEMVYERFYWTDSMNGKYVPKAAMYIPLQLDGIKGRYYAQLDLGSDATVLYEGSARGILDTHPQLAARMDSMGGARSDDGKRLFMIKGLAMSSGRIDLGKRQVYGYYNYGDPVNDHDTMPEARCIGTVGADVVQHRVLILDFPAQRFAITDRLPDSSRARFAFTKFRIVNNKIMLPVVINGVTYHMMYDTGSSIFSLLTTGKNWALLTDGQVRDTMEVSNFGNAVKLSGAKAKVSMSIGGKAYSDFMAYYSVAGFFDKFFSDGSCDGIIGNVPFLNTTICIDFEQKEFGVLR